MQLQMCLLHAALKRVALYVYDVVQVVGNIAAVSSSLHVGKAGPMVHTGACIAAIFGQGGSRKYGLTCRWLRYFKNDRDRRDLVTIGAGAGVAAAGAQRAYTL